MAFYWF